MKITPEMLKDHGACEDQYNLFVELFPDGVEITLELCVRYAGEFDFERAADDLLGLSQQKAYSGAIAPHWEAYDEAMALHVEVFAEAMAEHRKAYYEARDMHWKAYKEATAREFFRCSQL